MEKLKKLKVTKFGIGFFVRYLVNNFIGMVVAPSLIYIYGYTISVIFTTIMTIFLSFMVIKLYDLSRYDWLLIEELKRDQENKNFIPKNKIVKFIVLWTKKNKIILFFLFFFRDPMLTVLYFRKGYYLYNGLPSKEIRTVFLTSALATNMWWNFLLSIGFSLWDYLYPFGISLWIYLITKI